MNVLNLQQFVPQSAAPKSTAFVKPALFSFFAGAGFLDLGFEKMGFQTVFVNEFHRAFLDAYRFARLKMGIPTAMFGYLNDDIRALLERDEAASLQKRVEAAKRSFGLVGFVGGPPCPDFSVGGKNRGRHGENGVLSAVYSEIICEQQPDFFVFENVKGLWRTKIHRKFYEEIRAKFHEAGFATTERLINSIEYGAPQDRDRIILAGFRRKSFPKLEKAEAIDFPWLDHTKFERSVLESDMWPDRESFIPNQTKPAPPSVITELSVQYWFDRNDVANHPNSGDCFEPRAALPKFKTIDEGDDSKKCFKRLHRWRYSPTAAYGNNEVHLHPFRERRISVAEALAIQSLPKEFVMPPNMTLTDKFKAIGNGVPFEAAKGIAATVKAFLESVS